MEQLSLFRRHFFLIGALILLLIMVLVGGLKLAAGKSDKGGPGTGAAAAQQGGGRPGGGRGGPSPVSMVLVERHSFTDTLDLLGVAKGRQSVTLSAAATQLVSRVRFTPGDAVSQGQVLVELKSAEQDAGMAQAQARAVQADRALQRWKTLADQGYASKAAVDQYEAASLSARADVSAAAARQGDRTIRAPFSGVVGLSDIAPGSVINPGAAIVTLDDVSVIRVDFQVPDRFLSAVREGQAISASVDAYPGPPIQGRVVKLDTRIDERTRALTVRAEFPNPGRLIKPGMMMRVALAQGSREGLAVPESAVSVQGDYAFVYGLKAQGPKTMAERRPVVTGLRQAGWVEIKDGLALGDRVIADGLNKVQPGQPVRVAGAGGKPRR